MNGGKFSFFPDRRTDANIISNSTCQATLNSGRNGWSGGEEIFSFFSVFFSKGQISSITLSLRYTRFPISTSLPLASNQDWANIIAGR